MDIEVGKWYRRGDYRFIKVLEIQDHQAECFTITHHQEYNQIDKYVRDWDVDDLKEFFVETNEKTIDMLLKGELD